MLILSGGTGSRMGATVPKQFLTLGDAPVLAHSVRTFLSWQPDASLVLTAPREYLDETAELLRTHLGLNCAVQDTQNAVVETQAKRRQNTGMTDNQSHSRKPVIIVPGGATRHASTMAGLTPLLRDAHDADVILIHDAARPLITPDELNRLVRALDASRCSVASLAAPASETIVEADAIPGPMQRSLDRSRLFAVKTPQALRVHTARTLMRNIPEGDFTDLLTWAMAGGEIGELVMADNTNVKLTRAQDLPLLELLLSGSFFQ